MIALIGLFNMPVRAVTYPMLGEISSTNGEAKIYSMAGTTGHEAKPEDKNKSQHLITLKNGDKVKVLGEETDGDGDKWYKINYGENFENTGYAVVNKVALKYEYEFDEDFEKNLENFPESYRDALRALHAKYPNWKFVANKFDLTFKAAVEAQYGVAKVTDTRKWVEFTYGGNEWRDMRGYNAETNQWLTLESRWTYASRAAIEYFIDPRNSLNDQKIFVFALQSYNKDTQTKDGLRTVVADTFLANGYDGNPDAYLDDIMEAARLSGVSPYVLAATIIVEQGVKGETNLISGTYPNFEGYYNFFNFAASGATKDDIAVSGLTYAKDAKTLKYLYDDPNGVIPTPPPPPPEPVIKKGDTSGDDVINAIDLAAVKMHILGVKKLDGNAAKAGDVNGDGDINAIDLAAIKMHILGVKTIG